MSTTMVRVRGVRKSFQANEVLHGVDLEVERGETVCIIGPSGSGKSTLLRCLNHLEPADDGLIEVDGKVIGYRQDGNVLTELTPRALAHQRIGIGMVFQQFNLFPHMTARQNITEAPRRALKLSHTEANARAEELMARVGLSHKLDEYPEKLSGGQQHEVRTTTRTVERLRLTLLSTARTRRRHHVHSTARPCA